MGALLVFGLAHVGHADAPPGTGVRAGTQVAVSMAALCVAAIMALIGAFMTARR
jgi:hypothetical protein